MNKMTDIMQATSVDPPPQSSGSATDDRTEFDVTISAGLILELASTLGSTKSVILSIDQHRSNLVWGVSGSNCKNKRLYNCFET